MKTFKIYTFSQVITVKNCKEQEDAIKKSGLSPDVIFKIEQLPSDEYLNLIRKGTRTAKKIKYPDGSEGDLNGNFLIIL